MPEFSKINYYDLKWEALHKRLPGFVGRNNEIARLHRVLNRSLHHNAMVVGPSGIGKTAFIFGLAESISASESFSKKNLVLLEATTLHKVGSLPSSGLTLYLEAFQTFKNTVVILEGFGELVQNNPTALQNWTVLLKPALGKQDTSLIFTLTPQQLLYLEGEKSGLLNECEVLRLEKQPAEENILILKQALKKFRSQRKASASAQAIEAIIALSERFPSLGQSPKSAIGLLDEAITEAVSQYSIKPNKAQISPLLRFFQPGMVAAETPAISKAMVEKIVAEKTGIPLAQLNHNEKEKLKNLGSTLQKSIVGQQDAVGTIVGIIQRAKLGLRNPNKPLGSFLVLGPSGVGKTETAKILAKELYGGEKSFLRIDMSEFGEAHTAARLVGSPAGYVGFEEGGQLTNHFKNEPYSLVLLDEIEKAHGKIFDIFLQILDDGRLTSAKGETADFTQSIIMATSNLAVEEILASFRKGQSVSDENFIRNEIMPVLLKSFRAEFINRFDAIILFKPLSPADLTDIAVLEIKKIQERVKVHNITFNITRQLLAKKVESLYDPRFGARPVKRFVEQACESLITEKLLN